MGFWVRIQKMGINSVLPHNKTMHVHSFLSFLYFFFLIIKHIKTHINNSLNHRFEPLSLSLSNPNQTHISGEQLNERKIGKFENERKSREGERKMKMKRNGSKNERRIRKIQRQACTIRK